MGDGAGLPVPRESAYADKRSKDRGVQSASERAEDMMSGANVRRRGTGSPGRSVNVLTNIPDGPRASGSCFLGDLRSLVLTRASSPDVIAAGAAGLDARKP